MADFNISLERGNVKDGLGKLEANTGRGVSEGGLFAVRAVDKFGALVLGTLANGGEVGDVARGEFDFSLLLSGYVGRLAEGREIVGQVLLLILPNRRGQRGIGLEVTEGDANCLLFSSLEGLGELNSVVLGITMGNGKLASKVLRDGYI